MRGFLFVVFAAAACGSASAEVILNIPSQIVPPSSSPQDVSFDVGFVLTAPDVSQDLVGYDLYLEVAGGSGLSITGVGAGSDLLGSTPVYAVTADSAGDTLYYFTDFLLSGTGTISNGSTLLSVAAQLQAGATGTYQIAAYLNQSSPESTTFYSGLDGSDNPLAIAGMGFQNGAVGVAMPGDANLDGRVNINDLSIVLVHYNQTGMPWAQGEFTGSGTVDINDLSIVLAHYNQTLGSSVAAAAAVPEPSTLLLVLVGLLLLCVPFRRCKRQTQA